VTECRRGVLNGAHIRYLPQVLTSVCGVLGTTIAEWNGGDDHLHLWSSSYLMPGTLSEI
jgi:REP element-mobilizing transposase RayT